MSANNKTGRTNAEVAKQVTAVKTASGEVNKKANNVNNSMKAATANVREGHVMSATRHLQTGANNAGKAISELSRAINNAQKVKASPNATPQQQESAAKEVAGDNDVVLVTGNTTEETIKWLKNQGVIIVPMAQVQGVPIHVLRFISIYEFLRTNWAKYRFVVTTDVKDVYFQDDPFKMIEERCSKYYKLLIASEELKYKDEPWGDDNLKQAYGPYVYEQFKNNTIYHVGTFGGSSQYVKDMVFNIFTNAINRPISICDQAVFNVLLGTQPFKGVTYTSNNWACEAGTVADPSKIAQFRPNLLCYEPVFENGIVYTNDRYVFPIVHQYDRVPEWKKNVQEKFGQEDESQYFTYRI